MASYLERPSNCTITAAHDKSGVCRFVRMLCQRSLSTHTLSHSLTLNGRPGRMQVDEMAFSPNKLTSTTTSRHA